MADDMKQQGNKDAEESGKPVQLDKENKDKGQQDKQHQGGQQHQGGERQGQHGGQGGQQVQK